MSNGRLAKFKPWLDAGAVLARWVLGALFLYMGLKKALYPADFLKLLRQYDIAKMPSDN